MYKESSIVVYWWKHQHTESELRVKVDQHLAYAFESTTTIQEAATTSLTFTNLKPCMPYFFLVEVVTPRTDQKINGYFNLYQHLL
jgi:hypothetical protein